jgi:hypothetical protein
MLSKTMLLGLLKPLLPKLEGFLQNQELKEGEQTKILLDVQNGEIVILIVAIKENENKEIVITRELSKVSQDQL